MPYKMFEIKADNVDALCGASNCFQIFSEDGKKYGIRFSKNIYKDDTIEYYNMIIELVITCIIDYLFEILNLRILSNIALVQKVVKIGIYKIKITGAKNKDGYIPYVITELNNDSEKEIKDLYKFITSEIFVNPEIWTVEFITKFIQLLLIKIYNFYLLMYSLIGFKHGDFKTNNIIIEFNSNYKETRLVEELLKSFNVYIIDFEKSRINLQFNDNSGNYQNYVLDKRDHAYDIEGGEYPYKTFYDNINNKYFSSYLDFETLYWWLINPIGINLKIQKDIEKLKQTDPNAEKNLELLKSLNFNNYNTAISDFFKKSEIFFNTNFDYNNIHTQMPTSDTKITASGAAIYKALQTSRYKLTTTDTFLKLKDFNIDTLIIYRLNELANVFTNIIPEYRDHLNILTQVSNCILVKINFQDKSYYKKTQALLMPELLTNFNAIAETSFAGGKRHIKNSNYRNKTHKIKDSSITKKNNTRKHKNKHKTIKIRK